MKKLIDFCALFVVPIIVAVDSILYIFTVFGRLFFNWPSLVINYLLIIPIVLSLIILLILIGLLSIVIFRSSKRTQPKKI